MNSNRFKTFYKWFLRGIIFFAMLFLVMFFTGQVAVGWIDVISIWLMGSASLGLFFFLVEEYLMPYVMKRSMKKVVKVFGAVEMDAHHAKYHQGEFEVFVEIGYTLGMSKYAYNGEVISFHIPRHTLKKDSLVKPLSMENASLDGANTYLIYQTNTMGLKLAKRRIPEQLDQLHSSAEA
jgi:hypothetical protein